ncbi:hypothetical protein FRC12_014919, partial [Ceratobasidium sp. 428]
MKRSASFEVLALGVLLLAPSVVSIFVDDQTKGVFVSSGSLDWAALKRARVAFVNVMATSGV